ncbi:MAG TPA: SDR family NAD(P)-dependent oxidoreductase [Pyrinomonadaceae bacterium]|nr:SDR family NAD(P)-dependent oxidoreductase [Pyrinomonadaceae bacterium]
MSDFVLILGATSSIARHSAAAFARRGRPLFLAARNSTELERMAADLRIRYGVAVACAHFDAEDYASHEPFFAEVLERTDGLAGVLLAFGHLGEQEQSARDFTACEQTIARNFTGAVSILNLCANYFERRARGDMGKAGEAGGTGKSGEGAGAQSVRPRDGGRAFIVAVSSVAGDVGRQSNYIYGAAKGGLNVYLQGLRNRLHAAGARVVTVKPGFVDTPMIYGRHGLFLVARPEDVGERVARSALRGAEVVYVPGFWRFVMLALRLTPEALRKRLKL